MSAGPEDKLVFRYLLVEDSLRRVKRIIEEFAVYILLEVVPEDKRPEEQPVTLCPLTYCLEGTQRPALCAFRAFW